MKSSKRKATIKSPTKHILKSAPVIFVLVFLLGAFLVDLYHVIKSPSKPYGHKVYEHKQIEKKLMFMS